MQGRRILNKRIFIVIIAIILICLSMRYCTNKINAELSAQMQNSMGVVVKQNENVLKREMLSQYHLLQVVSKDLRDGRRSVSELMKDLGSVIDIYDFKRIGFVDKKGIVHTTDGYEKDLSFREFYKNGMQGKTSLTTILDDSMGKKEKINVFSMPVYEKDSKNILGVSFVTYRNEKLQSLFDYQSFDGNGRTYAFNSDGEIVASTDDTDIQKDKNLLSQLEAFDTSNKEAMNQIKNTIDTGKNSNGTFIVNGQRQYFHSVAINISNIEIYVLTTVPKSYLNKIEHPLNYAVHEMLFLVSAIIAICAVIIIYLQYTKKMEIQHYLGQDLLTKGDNSTAFARKLQKYKNQSGYAVSMDLSEFKLVNSTCGTKKGDLVLCETWKILSSHTKKGELVAHNSADDFVMFLRGVSDEEISKRISQMALEIKELSIKLSIPHIIPMFGISHIDCLKEREQEYSKANMAKDLVKGRRDRNYAFFSEIDLNKLEEQKQMEDDFLTSIKEERFELWFQPKVGVRSKICGAEVLVRWRDTEGNLVPPGKFIPLFEKNGMISTLDEYVFEHTCKQQRDWMQSGKQVVPVSVNISRASLYYSDVVERYIAIMKHYQVTPKEVQLEITESALADNRGARLLIKKFQDYGFKLNMDDFGHGYSSMELLSKSNFDILKLDKSLIDGIGQERGEILLRYLTGLAKKLGLSIVAEGVETKEQAEFIWKISCDAIQGYYYYRPLMKEDYEKYL